MNQDIINVLRDVLATLPEDKHFHPSDEDIAMGAPRRCWRCLKDRVAAAESMARHDEALVVSALRLKVLATRMEAFLEHAVVSGTAEHPRTILAEIRHELYGTPKDVLR